MDLKEGLDQSEAMLGPSARGMIGGQKTVGVRVLILVLSLEREPWQSLEQAQRETWIKSAENIECLWLRGIPKGLARNGFLLVRKALERIGLRHWFDKVSGRRGVCRPVRLDGDIVRTGTFEYWIGTSAKMRAGLPCIVERSDFDFLVRTNSSTYLHMQSLLEHLVDAPRYNYYGGADEGQAHARGTCIILSRDLVEHMANDADWDFHVVDDVAVGLSASRAGASLVPLPQFAIGSRQDLEEARRLLSSTNFIFRFKNRGYRGRDCVMMRSLHSILANSEYDELDDVCDT